MENPMDKALSEMGFETADFMDKPDEIQFPNYSADAIAVFIEQFKRYLAGLNDVGLGELWESNLTPLQAQARACLSKELFERQQPDLTRLFKQNDLERSKAIYAMLFPITLSFLAHNRLLEREIEHGLFISAETLQNMTAEDILQAIQQKASANHAERKYVCADVHPLLVARLDALEQSGLSENAMQTALGAVIAEKCISEVFLTHFSDYFLDGVGIPEMQTFTTQLVRISFHVIAYLESMI